MFKDNKDFYPTPKNLFDRLIGYRTRHIDGYVLEPSAGKGDMINYIQSKMGIRESYPIDAIEKDPHLTSILIGQGNSVVWDDFLTYETYKEYDYIIMNPPFSNGVDHLLKAIELAEEQITECRIYSILNKETINNAHTKKRQDLLRKLESYNADIEYVKDSFINAERETDVEVALIRFKVEKDNAGRSIYDSIPFHETEASEQLETALSTQVKDNELHERLNDIERLILEYETACELSRNTFSAMQDKQSFYSYINNVNKKEGEISGPLSHIEPHQKYYRVEDLNKELDNLRRGYWSLILDADEFRELLTNEARQKLNRQIQLAENMEINYANVRMLLTAIHNNQQDMLIDSIVSIFKKITTYHMNEYSTNIHYYDGWKTNDAYRINDKIIIPIQRGGFDSWDFKQEYELLITTGVKSWIDDIVKAFQIIDHSVNNDFKFIGNNSFENDLLRFRMFLNGNIHVWFNRKDLLEKLNYLCGQHFNWIPSDGEQERNPEAREWVAKEFGNNKVLLEVI